MVTVQDVGREFLCSAPDRPGKGVFIGGQLVCSQGVKAGAGVGHDIAHAWNGIFQTAVAKSDETTTFPGNAGDFGYLIAADASDEIIAMTGSRSLADDVLQVKAAAGAFRMLADKMEYLHGRSMSCLYLSASQGRAGGLLARHFLSCIGKSGSSILRSLITHTVILQTEISYRLLSMDNK
jgi:hypothetical protein